MRRAEIIDGAQELLTAIERSGVFDLLGSVIGANVDDRDKGGKSSEGHTARVLKAYKTYVLLSESFSPATEQINSILELDALNQEAFWGGLAMREDKSPRFHILFSNLNFLNSRLSMLVKLIEPEALVEFQKSTDEPDSPYSDIGLLTLLLVEEKNVPSKIKRITEALDSLDELYEACAKITFQSDAQGLSVVACDSGSDKSFDLLGMAKVIEVVKEVILSMWDRVIFYRERKLEGRFNLIAQSLPIIDKLGELEKNKKIGPEQAELIRRGIVNGVLKFLSVGAIIPEMGTQTSFDPRSLMAPEPKLLTAPADVNSEQPNKDESNGISDASEGSHGEASLDSLTDEDIVSLKKLLKEAKGSDKEGNGGEGDAGGSGDESSDTGDDNGGDPLPRKPKPKRKPKRK